MAFWCRIGKSKLKQLSHQFKTIPHGSLLNPTFSHSKARLSQNPDFFIHSKPTDFCSNVRFFAAPVQFQKQKKEDKETSGPRINEKITADVVRLVMDNEHTIVSRREALARARQLNLDLVEVSGKANPPVCKIMDFNKEMYQKEVRDKERAKAKADSTLRVGTPKEVRFSGKTEQKDLQMKADKVMALMVDGYKVKCTAKGTADHDVLATLSRLCALIQDVAVVESGPTLGIDSAFLIVRHIKFGALKKGGGKIKDLADANPEVLKAISTTAAAAEPSLETDGGSSFDEVNQASPSDSDICGSDKLETSDRTENRYKKGGTRNNSPPSKGMDHPGKRDSTWSEPHYSNQGRQSPRDVKFSQRTRESDEAAIDAPPFRNYRPPLNDAPRREPFSPGAPSTPRPHYSNFNGSTANAPGKHGVEAGVGENKEQNRYAARRPATRGDLAANQNLPSSRSDGSQPANGRSRQRGFGIFSRD
ncbi:translation initiation factor IF3-1, mitochondrial isoform X1 [Morus notabilis]|uniref:translation initiation factor IF3-1, mitochondrial isoform X1 n=2 Tax=Morus notabilis TaxID=981085 RepID=UPI000CED7348|nr:translation initiation factor IF3-1, mitochondrial isoform X1 [Morus notabilis]